MLRRRFEELRQFIERVQLDVRRDRHFAVEHEFQCGRIFLRSTSPVTAGRRVEGHQIGEPHFDFVGSEADDGEIRAEVEQTERGLLAGGAGEEGIFIEVTGEGVQVEVHIVADADANMLKLGETLQNSITRAIEEMVGLPVNAINVYIDDVALPAAPKLEKE